MVFSHGCILHPAARPSLRSGQKLLRYGCEEIPSQVKVRVHYVQTEESQGMAISALELFCSLAYHGAWLSTPKDG